MDNNQEKKQTLGLTHPELAKQWHPILNGNLTPQDVSLRSGKKVWWQCDRGHEWEAKIADRSNSNGCPYCSGRYPIVGETDLVTTHPEIAKEWHPTKNGDLKPENFKSGSHKKVWWKCQKDHKWETKIYVRTNSNGCPYCIGKLPITNETDLATTHPEIAKEWHPTKNENLKPENFKSGSSRKVWWKCQKGHEWKTTINSRSSQGTGCPYCSGKFPIANETDLATTHPEIAKEWHPTKNGDLKPENFKSGSNKKVWWTCQKGHEWLTGISHRTQGTNCPYCSNNKLLLGFNDLYTKYPKLAEEWHPTKNGDLTPQEMIAGSSQKVWWKCQKGHEWKTTINSRSSQGTGCPYCSGKFPIANETDLATTHPKLVKEWHPTKNGDLKPENFKSGSHKKVWWKCQKDHEWVAKIQDRANGNGCPYCSGKRIIVGKTDLATTHPDLANEWHPTKNGTLTPQNVSHGSSRKVWWKCQKGHEWEATISSRSGQGIGCPSCNHYGTSFPEQCLFFYLQKVFPDSQNRDEFEFENNIVEIDIFIPEISLAIEYDGLHWHKSKVEQDSQKSKLIKSKYEFIRIREKGLSMIPGDYCIFTTKSKNDIKFFVKHTFDFIVENFPLPFSTIELIKKLKINPNKDRMKILEKYHISEYKKSILITHPKLAKEWHPTKNRSLKPENFKSGSNEMIWWQCERGHEWESKICNRVKGNNCPYCSGKYPIIGETDLVTTHPELAKEWHPTKNGGLKPENFKSGSNKLKWWKCQNGHEWEAKIQDRANGNGCPYCSGRYPIIGETDLATTHPKLAKEWHPTKNGDLKPEKFKSGSSKKVWWKCQNGHEWEAYICNRSREKGTNCPHCRRESKR